MSFLLHRQHFRIPNFTPKNWLKTHQNTQKCPWKVKYMQFLYSIWKMLHLTEYFYTGTAHGARDNYEVCNCMYVCSPKFDSTNISSEFLISCSHVKGWLVNLFIFPKLVWCQAVAIADPDSGQVPIRSINSNFLGICISYFCI